MHQITFLKIRKKLNIQSCINHVLIRSFVKFSLFFFLQRDGCTPDTVNSVKYLKEVYRKVDPGLTLNDKILIRKVIRSIKNFAVVISKLSHIVNHAIAHNLIWKFTN